MAFKVTNPLQPQPAALDPQPVASEPVPAPVQPPAPVPAVNPADPMSMMAAMMAPSMRTLLAPHFAPAGASGRPAPITVANSHTFVPADGTRSHAYLPLAVALAAQGVHMWLVGGAGTGKSHLMAEIAQVLGREYEVESASSQTTESKLLGFVTANGEPVITPAARAYEHGRVYGIDEADASGAVAVGLNRMLANGSATFAGRHITRHPDFMCIATANTRGSGQAEGFRREPQDAALLDRFFMLELPQDLGLERHLAGLSQSPKYPSPTCDIARGGTIDADGWYNLLSAARDHAAKLQIRSTFKTSNRPVQMGCKLAQAGIGKYWLAQGLLRRSMAQNDWDKLAQALNLEP